MSWALIQNSLLVATATMLLASLLGSAFALFASALPRVWRVCGVSLTLAAFVLPPFLISNTWLNYFGLNGSWRSFLDFDIYSLRGTVLLLTLQLWPITALVLLGSILRIDRTYLEQEPLLRGANLLRYLLWPNARPALAFALPLTFVLALNNFTVPALLQTKVFAAEVWLSFNTKFDYAEALRLSWPLVVTPLVLLLLLRSQPIRFIARSSTFSDTLWRSRLGLLFPLTTLASTVLVFLSLVLPLTQLVSSPRTWVELNPAIAAGLSAAAHSLLYAFTSAALVLLLGGLASRARGGAVSWLFFLMPGVFIGMAAIRIFNHPIFSWFYQGIGIVLFAFTLRYFALGWSAARAALLLTDRSLSDVVGTLGGSAWKRFWLADWPQVRGVFLASFYLVYLLGLWEVETLILIVPPGGETLAVRIFNMLHYGHAAQADALCVEMLLLGLAPFLVFALISMLRAACRFSAASVTIALLLCGCGVANDRSTKLDSKIFAAVQIFGTRGNGAGEFNKPRSIAIDRLDNFYVVDMTGRVQKFSPDGAFLLSWQMPQTEKGKPKGMGCDLNGNIIVVEPHYSRVNHFTPEGQLVTQWGQNGTNPGQLYFPRSVAINSHGEIYLSEYGMVERIQRFSVSGTNFLGTIGQPGTGPGDLNRAEGIGLAPDDTLFEADSCNHRVQVFSPEGKLLTSFGSAGSGQNQMSYPYDVKVDPVGYRYVCEFGNSRVQIFDQQNHFLEFLGGPGASPREMNNPWSIALDSRGNLYVADSLNHRVQKFIRREPLRPDLHTSAPLASTAVAAR